MNPLLHRLTVSTSVFCRLRPVIVHRLPPSRIVRRPPPSRIVRRLPPSRIVRRLPPSRIVRRLPPSRIIRRLPPSRIVRRLPPSRIIRRLPPSRIVRRLPPSRIVCRLPQLVRHQGSLHLRSSIISRLPPCVRSRLEEGLPVDRVWQGGQLDAVLVVCRPEAWHDLADDRHRELPPEDRPRQRPVERPSPVSRLHRQDTTWCCARSGCHCGQASQRGDAGHASLLLAGGRRGGQHEVQELHVVPARLWRHGRIGFAPWHERQPRFASSF